MAGQDWAEVARAPGLRKGLFNLYRAVWIGLLGLAVFVTLAGAWLTTRYYEDLFRPFVSLGLRWNYAKTVSLTIPITLKGDLATIRPGDVIVSVEGQPVSHDYRHIAELTHALKVAPGPVVEIRTRSPDGALRDHRLVRNPAVDATVDGSIMHGHDLLIFRQIIAFISASLAIAAAVLLFSRRPRDPAAAVMSLALLLVSLGSELSLAVNAFIPVLAPALFLLTSISIGAQVFAILLFPEGRLRGGLSVVVAILAVVMVVVWPLSRFEVIVLPFGTRQWMGSLVATLAVGSLFLRYRRLPPGLQQQQIRWALLGFAFAVVLVPAAGMVNQYAYTSTAVRWSTVYIAAGAAISALALTCVVGGLLVSLLRYRLYDADAIISRSATFAVVTLGLGAGWAGAEKAIEVFLEGTMGHGAGAASAGIAAAIAALLVSPLHQRVHHAVDNVFQRKLADLRRTLPEVVGDLRESASLDELLAYVLGRVSGALRATCGAILLQGEQGLKVGATDQIDEPQVAAWLANFHPVDGQPAHDRADPLFPFRHPLTVDRGDTRVTVGWIVLGPRPDGSFHSKDELQAVREAAGPIARAIQIVLARQARESAILSEMGRLKKEMATLRLGRRTSGRPAA